MRLVQKALPLARHQRVLQMHPARRHRLPLYPLRRNKGGRGRRRVGSAQFAGNVRIFILINSTRLMSPFIPAYTSLLRITTAPPPMAASDLEGGKRASVSSSMEGSHPLATDATANPPPTETRSGFAASLPRPGFLRHFSRNPANTNANVADTMTAPDLERGQPQLVAGNA